MRGRIRRLNSLKPWSAITGIALVVALVLILAPFRVDVNTGGLLSISLSQVSANPDWLSDYEYRKEKPIDGSTDGAQTDYQMKLTVYKKAAPFADNGIAQPLYPNLVYPSAYYYNGITYVVWQGDLALSLYIDCYTHSTGTWHGAVKVGTNPLSGDTHGTPAVIVDNSGYIHVFYGCHSSPLKYAKSTNTEDISAWSAQSDIGSTCTYPNVIKDGDGNLYLFTRDTGAGSICDVYYRKSTDWETSYKIIEAEVAPDAIYYSNAEYDSANGLIYIAWVHLDSSASQWENVHLAYLKLGDGHMYSMAGTDLGTTISFAEAGTHCKVVDSGAYNVGPGISLHLDSNGYPCIIYNISTDEGWEWQSIKWNGSSWDSTQKITDTNNTFTTASADFIINGDSDFDAYLAAFDDLEKWHWNGSSWAKTSTILAGTDVYYDGLSYPKVTVNGVAGLQCIFSEIDLGVYTHADLRVYATNSNDEFLGARDTVQLDENCQDDFDDVRFTTSDGSTELDFWQPDSAPEYVSGKHSTCYIEFDSIPASPDSATFYIYYDNSGASSGSNGANTFPSLFDDFDGDAEPPSGWSETQIGTLTWSDLTQDGKYKVYNFQDSAAEWHGNEIYKAVTPPTTFALVAKQVVACSADDGIPQHESHLKGYKSSALKFAVGFEDGWTDYKGAIYSAITGTTSSEDMGTRGGATYIFEIRRDGTNIKTYWNGILRQTKAEVETLDEVRFRLVGGRSISSSDPQTELGYVFLRKYVDPEPTWGDWGDEEGFNPEISNTPSSWAIGVVGTSDVVYFSATGAQDDDYALITNTGNCVVDIQIQGQDIEGGSYDWVLASTADSEQYSLYANSEATPTVYDIEVKSSSYNNLCADLVEDDTYSWSIKFTAPTAFNANEDGEQKATTVTLVASASS